MPKNIFIVEGLPGVGKSYFCEVLQQELRDKAAITEIHFFEERDMDHPFNCSEEDISDDVWSIEYRDCFRIVESKCHKFFSSTYQPDEIYIFDCGPLQRPLFCSMLMSDFSEEEAHKHLLQLHSNYDKLPFQYVYLESKAFKRDFECIYINRGLDYQAHVEKVWNNSRHGTKHKLKGLEGATQVLTYFKALKLRFLEKLNLSPTIIDNTAREPRVLREMASELLGRT
jgi:hypothetical protein